MRGLAPAFLALLCLPGALPGQRYTFRHYGREDGLTSLAVQCMLQDRTGFLWVGTQNGLFRYDGCRFQGFYREDGLPSSQIESLHESADGSLWMGTPRGLARRAGDRFARIDIGKPYEMYGQFGVASDRTGRVYAVTSAGLLVGQPGRFRSELDWVLQPDAPGIRREPVVSVYVDPGGAVWLGRGMGIARLESGGIVPLGKEFGVPEDRWDSMLADREGNLWIRSPGHLLVRWKGAELFVRTDERLAPSPTVGSLYTDSDGRLFVPTVLGLAVRDGKRWDLIGAANGLAADSVSCLLEDREGSLWVGTYGSGVARWLGGREWEGWTRAEGLGNQSIWQIRRDSSGTIWVGTDDGLSYWAPGEPGWNLWTRTTTPVGRIWSLEAGPDGALWIGAEPGGLLHLDPRAGTMRRFSTESGLPESRVLSLVFDHEGRLWAATPRGLYRSSGARPPMRFEQMLPPSSHELWRYHRLATDRQGRLWAAADQGLLCFDRGTWIRFAAQDGLRSDRVQFLASAPDDSIWIGYRDALGISRLSFETGRLRIEHFSRAEGLASDRAAFLGVDARGSIWYGSDDGADVFDGKSWQHYGRQDGLIWDDCNDDAFFAETDGSVWIGTSRGLSRFRPSVRPRPQPPPPVLLTEVRFGQRFVDPSGPVRISYGDRSLLVKFAGLTFLDESAVRFRYRLAGIQAEWLETSQREVHYPALPPGAHTFEVMARSAGGVWSAQPARVSFRILPPWWETWWFRGFSLATLVMASWGAWRLRLRRLVERRSRLRLRRLLEEQRRMGQPLPRSRIEAD